MQARSSNSKRNLCFLLLDLSDFVVRVEICPELSLLLLKQALLIFHGLIHEWQTKSSSSTESEQFLMILKSEYRHMGKLFEMLKTAY